MLNRLFAFYYYWILALVSGVTDHRFRLETLNGAFNFET